MRVVGTFMTFNTGNYTWSSTSLNGWE